MAFMSNDACSSYNSIVTTFREVPLEPQGKTQDKIHEGKTQDQTKHILEVLLRVSVGYIGSDRGRSVWQSEEY